MKLKLLFLFLACSCIRTEAEEDIPSGFLIGVGSSAYQTEGAWNISGKGISIWDQYTHERPWRIVDGSNGDIACDSYNRYKEDVQLLKTIGVDFYKFSISWPRILPNGYTDVINKDGIRHYKNLIDELRSNGIEPFITLYHWDHPEVLERLGGWTNELMVDYFVDYARVVFNELGSKVKYFLTINEPSIFCPYSYGDTYLAPGKNLTYDGKYLCAHNMLKAHALVYHMYDKEFRPKYNGLISITHACKSYYSLDKSDYFSDEVAFQFDCGWIAHPIFSVDGDYPVIMKNRIAENSKAQGLARSKLPEFDDYWVNLIRGSADFFALNHYTTYVVYPVNDTKLPWYNDLGLNTTKDASWETAGNPFITVVPAGFGKLLRKISDKYNNPIVYIVENGCADVQESLYDLQRIDYLYSYMEEILSAIVEGCNIKAYTIWSLLDNFEWAQGYMERFGIVHVNYTDPNRKRTLKSSAVWLNKVIKSRKLIPYIEQCSGSTEYGPQITDCQNDVTDKPGSSGIVIQLSKGLYFFILMSKMIQYLWQI